MDGITKETIEKMCKACCDIREIRSTLSCPLFTCEEHNAIRKIYSDLNKLIDDICERVDAEKENDDKFNWFVKRYKYKDMDPYCIRSEVTEDGITVRMTHVKYTPEEIAMAGWSDDKKDVLIAIYDGKSNERTILAWSNIEYNNEYAAREKH
ncbi:MAG: hypothetical protein WC175_05910 [Candidatus Dojkabacteria bacterium]